MEKYKIKSSILTMLNMERWKLVTHEIVKDAYKGKFMGMYGSGKSIHESLESFVMKLRNHEIKEESVTSFFTPMLTENEVQLIKCKHRQYLETFGIHNRYGMNPDVEPEQMAKSDSESKFVNVTCRRFTLPLKIASRKRKINKIS